MQAYMYSFWPIAQITNLCVFVWARSDQQKIGQFVPGNYGHRFGHPIDKDGGSVVGVAFEDQMTDGPIEWIQGEVHVTRRRNAHLKCFLEF